VGSLFGHRDLAVAAAKTKPDEVEEPDVEF
jgi:hypothetical protein